MNLRGFVPVTYHGEHYDDYFVNRTGKVWSAKKNKFLAIKQGKKSTDYPGMRLRKNNKTKYMQLHRIVAESFVELKRPKDSGISPSQWKKTPKTIKRFIMELMFVNHIDHNKENYHYKNLEWVTPTQNARARDEFYNI